MAVRDWSRNLQWADAILQPDERERVQRQRMPADREVLTLAYGLHRAFLAQRLGCSPTSVPLYRDGSGRPRVVGDDIWTSLSHTRDWLAFAACRCSPVGIDIEPVTRVQVMDEVVHAVCHPDEVGRLHALDTEARRHELLSLWVRKEAVLKAAGVGLHVPMESFTATGIDQVLIPGVEGLWHISSIDSGAHARAAVAAGRPFRIEPRRIDVEPAFSPAHDIASSTDDS